LKYFRRVFGGDENNFGVDAKNNIFSRRADNENSFALKKVSGLSGRTHNRTGKIARMNSLETVKCVFARSYCAMRARLLHELSSARRNPFRVAGVIYSA
jgi:hypothetical protein